MSALGDLRRRPHPATRASYIWSSAATVARAARDHRNLPVAVYIRSMPTLFEHAGGEEALHRLEQSFYDSVLADPLLQPLFGAGRPDHVDHLTAFTAESFGGPDRFSRELGFAGLISVHRGLRITEEQRRRFVELYMAALDATDMPSDPAFREAVREHVEFGSKVAMQNSHADNDDELYPLHEVPRWTWAGDDGG
jgi:hemoglobin